MLYGESIKLNESLFCMSIKHSLSICILNKVSLQTNKVGRSLAGMNLMNTIPIPMNAPALVNASCYCF